MASNGNTYLFVSIVVFYTLLMVFSNVFDVVITNNSEDLTRTDLEKMGFWDRAKAMYEKGVSVTFSTLDNIPIANYFTPILKIMSFGFTNEIPVIVSILLNMVNVFTAFIVLDQFRGFL